MLSSKLPIFRCSPHVSATSSCFLSGLSSSVALMSTNSFSTSCSNNRNSSNSFINSNTSIRHHFNNNQQQQHTSPRMISSSIFRLTRTLLSSENNSNNNSSAFDEEPKKQDNFAVPSWTNPNARNLYTRLGLRSNASTLDIKKHYRHLAKLYHPDSNSGDKEAEEKFRKVKEAYETLSNTDKRKVYDATGASGSEQEQAGFGGQASYRQYQWSGSGLHGKYNIRFDENGRPIFEVPRWIWFIMFFSVGMFISAFRELRSRKHNKEIPNDLSREHELGVQRSSLWRPFIAMMLFMSFLPRLPACICCWWFYVYRPTIQAEDRATMDNITIIMNDQFNGTAVNMTLASPFLELAQKKWNAKTKDAEEYIMTVTLRPTISTSLNQQVANSNNDSSQEENSNNNSNAQSQSQQQQQQIAPPAVEYPNGQTNHFQMSFPRPRSADGKTILPCTATVRVKQVVRGKDQKLDLESSKTIFERQLTIV